MPTEETEQRRKLWIVEWFKDEQFWKDITKSVLSALIVVIIAYLYGVTTGYLARPEIASFLSVVFIFGTIALTLGICLGFLRAAIRDRRDKQAALIYGVTAVAILLFGIGTWLEFFVV